MLLVNYLGRRCAHMMIEIAICHQRVSTDTISNSIVHWDKHWAVESAMLLAQPLAHVYMPWHLDHLL